MRLAIVHVTQPSRTIFFERALTVLSELLARYEWIDSIIILNGYSSQNQIMASALKSKFPNRVRVFDSHTNLSMPHEILDFLRPLAIDWVQFPGDDDILIPESYEDLLSEIENEELSAIAFSAECIDPAEKPLGKILRPSFPEGSNAENLIAAISLPPFVFPSLVFRLSALETSIFSSTLVFDWWLSLTLMSKGHIKVKPSTLVKYRLHSGQISNAVRESRKRFEAGLMIRTFFLEESDWMISQLGESASDIPRLLAKYPPIYGDRYLGARVIFDLRALLGERLPISDSVLSDFSQGIALSDGVIMAEHEFPYSRLISAKQSSPRLNLGFSILPGTCSKMRMRLGAVRNPRLTNSYHVGCHHSVKTSRKSTVVLDCTLSFDLNQTSTWIAHLVESFYLADLDLRPRLSELSASEARLLRSFRSLAQFLRFWRRLAHKFRFTRGGRR